MLAFTDCRSDKKDAKKPEGLGELLAQSSALASLNKVVEQRDFGANLARELARPDLKLKPSEFLAIWGASTVGLPVVFFVLGFVLPSFGSIIALMLIWEGFAKSGILTPFLLPSIETIFACACGERTKAACAWAGSSTSSVNRPCPVSSFWSSSRRSGLPIHWLAPG